MMERTPGAITTADPVTGDLVGAIPPLRLDTLLLHAARPMRSGMCRSSAPARSISP